MRLFTLLAKISVYDYNFAPSGKSELGPLEMAYHPGDECAPCVNPPSQSHSTTSLCFQMLAKKSFEMFMQLHLGVQND